MWHIVTIIIWIIGASIFLWFLLEGIYWCLDYLFQDIIRGQGVLVSKNYNKGDDLFETPDEYFFKIKVADQICTYKTFYGGYYGVEEGDTLYVWYLTGRFSKKVVINVCYNLRHKRYI